MIRKITSFVMAAVMVLALFPFMLLSENSANVIAASEENDKIAHPEHDYVYGNMDMKSSLFNCTYYKTKNAYFKDEANIFNSVSYYKQFYENLQAAADETGMNVAIFLGGLYRSDSVTENFTREGIKTLFSMEWDENSVFLYLDFEGKSKSYDYICTCHDAKLYYPDSGLSDRVEDMIEHMYKYLPKSGETIYKKDVQDAINSFLVDIKSYKKKGPAWDSGYYNEEKGCYRCVYFGNIVEQSFPPYKYFVAFLAIGIIIGIIIGIYGDKMIRKQYKFRELQKASVYTSNKRIRFNEVTDQFLHEHTTKTYIPPSSSSGGHGGHGGGGGSFGGGGGHR